MPGPSSLVMSQLHNSIGRGGQQLRGCVVGMPQLVPPLPHLALRGQEAIHRALGTEVVPFVEQGGVDLGRGQVHEARLVQHVQDRGLLPGAEGAGRPRPRRQGTLGPPPSVVGRTGQPERRARGRDAQPRSDLGDRRHQEGSVVSGVPSNAAICFCSSTSASARSARFRQRRVLALQLGDLLVAGIGHPPHGAALRRRPGQLPALPRRAPRRQMGGVQPLPSQQRPDRARRLTARRPPGRSSACTPP